ncbi:MAG: phage virion morphogenesis protein [Treponema sp.]|jgi:phage virion morphogenesis protein|nr:phage virion morphogenesis protein [Treponema sp.]
MADTQGASVSFDLKEIDAVQKLLAKAALSSTDRARLLRGIGLEIEEQTKERFETQKSPDGDSWKALAQQTAAYYASKGLLGARSILVGEGALRDSIASEVQGGAWSVLVGATMEYAAVHQFGAEITPKNATALFVPGYGMLKKVTIPARPYLGVSPDDTKAIESAVAAFLAGNST